MFNQDFGEKETDEYDNCDIQNKVTIRDYFAPMKVDEAAINSKFVLKPAIDSPLPHFLFLRDNLLKIGPFFKVFKCGCHFNFFDVSNSIISLVIKVICV